MDWLIHIYLFLSPFRSKVFESISLERIGYYLQKDKMLKELSQDVYYKWKSFILDKAFSSNPCRYDPTPDWMFYSPQMLSMTYSHMFRRLQEENKMMLCKYHHKFLENDNQIQFRIGVLWYQSRCWFLTENLFSGEMVLLW